MKSKERWGRRVCHLCAPKIVDFDWLGRFRRHITTHRDSTATYTCPLCWFTATGQAQMLQHNTEHGRNEVLAKCPHPSCSVIFVSWGGYRDHILRKHQMKAEDGGTLFKCHLTADACQFTTTTPQAWVKHTVMEVQRFCNYCQQRFANRTSLQAHLAKSHRGTETNGTAKEKKKKEMDPHKEAKMRQELEKGELMLQVDKKRRFKCPFCRPFKWFLFEGNIRAHMKQLHSLTIPFKCKDCSRIFKTKTNFQRHHLSTCRKPKSSQKMPKITSDSTPRSGSTTSVDATSPLSANVSELSVPTFTFPKNSGSSSLKVMDLVTLYPQRVGNSIVYRSTPPAPKPIREVPDASEFPKDSTPLPKTLIKREYL